MLSLGFESDERVRSLFIMWTTGAGSEVMRRIAAPMVGGMISAPLLSMLVIPVVYRLLRQRGRENVPTAMPLATG